MYKVPKALRPPRGLWRSPVVIASVILLLILTATLASPPFTVAQDGPPAPANIMAVNGPNPGETIVTWDAVDGANFYRIGWLSRTDYQNAGDDWLERFAFSEVEDKTSYTVTRLTPGEYYWFIVASNATRDGAPTWPTTWAPLTLNEDDAACPIAETTPAAMPSAGDGTKRSSPIAYGQRFQAGVFDMQITSVDTDAWPEIQAANRRADPPPAGTQYVRWEISVWNQRGSFDESEEINWADFDLVGTRGVEYGRSTCCPEENIFSGGFAVLWVRYTVHIDEIGDGLNLRYYDSQTTDDVDGSLSVWFVALPPA